MGWALNAEGTWNKGSTCPSPSPRGTGWPLSWPLPTLPAHKCRLDQELAAYSLCEFRQVIFSLWAPGTSSEVADVSSQARFQPYQPGMREPGCDLPALPWVPAGAPASRSQ